MTTSAPGASPSVRFTQIVEQARLLYEEQGPEGLTMRSLAARLGIRAPSLYNHVRGKDELEVLLIVEALRGMGESLHAALTSVPARSPRRTALTALAAAYRSWALAHPHLYRLATGGELAREQLPEGLEAWTAAPLVGVAGGEHRARAAWAFAHGMTILELDGRFPPSADLDAAWAEGVAALT